MENVGIYIYVYIYVDIQMCQVVSRCVKLCQVVPSVRQSCVHCMSVIFGPWKCGLSACIHGCHHPHGTSKVPVTLNGPQSRTHWPRSGT